METSQQQQHPLSIESFSYSWLAANLKPSLETLLDAADEYSPASSYIEMDPRMPPSKRFFRSYSSSHEFNFDFPADHSPPMNHADELFADGYLVPFFLRKAASHRDHRDHDCEDDSTSNSVASSPDSTGSTIDDRPVRSGLKKTRRCSSFRRVVEKYLELIGPLLGKLSGRRGGPRNRRSLSSRSEGMVMDSSNKNKKKLMMKRWLSSSGESSPRRVSAAYSEDGWRRSASSSCDSESSIREAVLHCKKSFGK
ncbi:unnamed protein product [Linum tenue]|uniref:Membrane-associated kinase regulator 6 n=1 Tax=Linum tenue TaxID=586396 RepID=A0AAV0QMP2_9ROSI|nr:unnamed protein product [Linum tenue]